MATTAKKKQLPPWMQDGSKKATPPRKPGAPASASTATSGSGNKATPFGRGKAPSAGKNTPISATPKDARKQGRGKKPGATPGTAAAKKGSAKGGRKSKRS